MRNSSSLKSCFVTGLLLLTSIVASCDSSSVTPTKTDSEIQALADKYMYDTGMSKNEVAEFRSQLGQMSPADSVRFFQKLRVAQGLANGTTNRSDPSGIALEIDDYLNDLATEKQVNRFLLPRQAMEKGVATRFNVDISGPATKPVAKPSKVTSDGIEQDSKALCVPPYVSCSTGSFPYSVSYWFCASNNCNYGYMNDRVSNDACELVGCDHRIWYPTGNWRATKVDGLTSMTDCLVNYWPSMITDYDGSNTKVLYGYGGALVCGIYSTNYIQAYTWVQQ